MSPTTRLETAEGILDNFGKLKVADHARLMADNQSTLERTSRSDVEHRDYTRRVREAQARSVFGSDWEPATPVKPGDDQMQIFIDSPVTISRPDSTPTPTVTPTQPTQQAPTPPSPAPKLWPWVLAAAAGLAGFGLPHVFNRPDPPAASIEFPPFPQYDVEKWIPSP